MGGGARTAYQAGVLKAVAAMLPEGGAAFPFRWLFGTSAGALNASFLACRADDGAAALPALGEFWLKLRSDQVYRLEAPTWVRASRVLAGWTLARQVKRHRALLDTLPLVDTLHRAIDLGFAEMKEMLALKGMPDNADFLISILKDTLAFDAPFGDMVEQSQAAAEKDNQMLKNMAKLGIPEE